MRGGVEDSVPETPTRRGEEVPGQDQGVHVDLENARAMEYVSMALTYRSLPRRQSRPASCSAKQRSA